MNKGVLFLAAAAFAMEFSARAPAEDFSAAKAQFDTTCASCHGAGGAGGDRAPALMDNPDLRKRDAAGIAAVIRTGTPRGMPAFASLPRAEVARLALWIHSMNISAFKSAPSDQVAAGEKLFFGSAGCAACHMARGRGRSNGPDLSAVAARSSTDEIAAMLDHPQTPMPGRSIPACPSWAFCPDTEWSVVDVRLKSGATLRGFARNETEHELQLQSFDGKLHLLARDDYTLVAREKQSFMPPFRGSTGERRDLLAYLSSLGGIAAGPLAGPVAPVSQADIDAVIKPKPGEWPSYNGGLDGNRYSVLSQITAANVRRLVPQWIFSPGGSSLEGTPLVLGGIMYVTGGPTVCALDAHNGNRIWCVPRTNGLGVPAVGGGKRAPAAVPVGPNRGVAVLGNHVFYISDDAYLVCLDRLTGAVMWSVWLPETGASGKFYSSEAPLVVGDLVIGGVAGGDSPMRGFVAAYHATTGQLAWRFYTIPKPGEPLAASWKGSALPTGGGATWSTGSYDAGTGTLYWAVGNPYPDTDLGERGGRNLYTNSVVALDVKTGKLKWYFQFTPWDTHDWDATQPLLLVDARYRGADRKLLLSAQRSGIFYVLDRADGKFLLAKPFVRKMSWARGFGPDGTPILAPGNTPTVTGVKSCPAVRGATNWYASAFSPQTRFFYVMAAEDCGIYRSKGNIFGNNPDISDLGTRALEAIDIETGKIVWQKPLVGPQETNYTGVLATAGGLVFHGETGGDFAAVDAGTGRTLWTFPANDSWRASPMTYTVGGRQYVAGIAGSTLVTFALGQ